MLQCSYHNFYHGVDVALGTRWILANTRVCDVLSKLDCLSLLASAIG